MAENKEKVIVDFSVQDSGVNKALAKMGEGFDSARAKSKALEDKLENMGKVGQKLAIGAGVVAGALGAIGVSALKASGQFEQWNIAFTTMLGSQSKATKLMNEIKSFAAKTPFELPGLVESSKQLLAFGFAAEEIIPNMKVLGDIAAGVGVPVGQLANVFGQVKLAGRLMGQDLLQFTNAGVPLISALAKNLGVTEGEIKKMVEAGKIGFPEVQKALTGMTTEGGKFFNLMDAQSKSLEGVISNIKDNIGQFLTGLGDALLPLAKIFATVFQNLTSALASMSPEMKQVVAVVGAVVFVFASLLTGLGVFLTMAGPIAAGWALIGGAVSAAVWPLTLIVLGLAAVTVAAMTLINMLKPLAEKTDALAEKHEGLKEKARNLKDQLAELEAQGKKNTSQYLKLQDELKRTNSEIEKNAQALQKNIEKLELEKKAIEEKIKAQQKVVAQNPQNTGEVEKLEALERQRLAIISASENAITALKVEQETVRTAAVNEVIENDKLAREQRAAFEKDLKKQADDIEMEELRAKWLQMSDDELRQKGVTEEAITNLHKIKDKERNVARQKMAQEMGGFIEKAAENEQDIAKAVAKGTLEWAKQGMIAQAKAWATGLIQQGLANLPLLLVGNPIGPLQIAAGGALMAGAPAAINAIQLAEGGSMVVDKPTQIGRNVIAGEAGPEEIKVTPLKEKSEDMTINNNIYIDGELITTQVLKTGQSRRKEGFIDDLSAL